jgi:glutamate racemase
LHVPYGDRSIEEIIVLTDSAIQPLLIAKCDVIILACNTATAAAIQIIRDKYPNTPFIGLEPMVKPAASMTKSGIIAVCATSFTLTSDRYNALKKKYASNIKILEPDCSGWARMIELNAIDEVSIVDRTNDVCESGADVIVLACTHYHWIKEKIHTIANGRAIVIDPSDAISQRVYDILYVSRSSKLID